MPTTYTLIASNTLSSTASSVTFSSIPSTYTDLVVIVSSRQSTTAEQLWLRLNGSSATNYSTIRLLGNGTSASSGSFSNLGYLLVNGGSNPSDYTSNTFASAEIYIPNYTVSQNKQISSSAVTENNSTTSYVVQHSNLWQDTSTITSIVLLLSSGNFVANSSFYLYGIKKS